MFITNYDYDKQSSNFLFILYTYYICLYLLYTITEPEDFKDNKVFYL